MLSKGYPLSDPDANLNDMTISNGSLVPTPVVDKNGRTTTVHKKPTPSSSASAALGAVPPTLAATEEDAPRPFYPTRKQGEARHFSKTLRYDKIDRRLPNKGTDYEWVSFTASDLEVYDVFSATRDNYIGMMLLNHGIRSAEDARSLMVSLDAENLIDDRTEMAQKALSRRIDSAMMLDFGDYHNPALWHTGEHLDRYLDGVELYSFPKFQSRKGPLLSDVLTGKIRLDDIKTIGLKTIANHFNNDDDDLKTLRSLADGSANYTAEQLRDACKTAGGDSFTYWMVRRMCITHGGEWAAGINWMVGAAAQGQWRRGETVGDEKEAITYANDFHQKLGGKVSESIALYKAGVPLEFAIEKLGESRSFTVEQVIAMNEGVPAPMTSGWI